MASRLAPPVESLRLVTAYPKVKATMEKATLDSVTLPGKPVVIHLYTG